VGLTSVSDAGTAADELAVLHQRVAAGSLSLRLNVFLSWDAFTEIGTDVRADSVANDMLRVRTVKMYIDGALGSRGPRCSNHTTTRRTAAACCRCRSKS
jgi:predicted amidohydrolase YtcJ